MSEQEFENALEKARARRLEVRRNMEVELKIQNDELMETLSEDVDAAVVEKLGLRVVHEIGKDEEGGEGPWWRAMPKSSVAMDVPGQRMQILVEPAESGDWLLSVWRKEGDAVRYDKSIFCYWVHKGELQKELLSYYLEGTEPEDTGVTAETINTNAFSSRW